MSEKVKTYQELKAELDTVMAALRSEDTDVDQALVLHKQGTELLKKLEAYLNEVTKKVEPQDAK